MRKKYVGIRETSGCFVFTPQNQLLDLRLDLCNHSPTGFNWGYGGSGPAQLALALLAWHLHAVHCNVRADQRALELYQQFKWDVIARLPDERWELTLTEVNAAIERIEEAQP